MAGLSSVQRDFVHLMRRQGFAYLQCDSYGWNFYRVDGTRSYQAVPGNSRTILALEKAGYLKREGFKLRLTGMAL